VDKKLSGIAPYLVENLSRYQALNVLVKEFQSLGFDKCYSKHSDEEVIQVGESIFPALEFQFQMQLAKDIIKRSPAPQVENNDALDFHENMCMQATLIGGYWGYISFVAQKYASLWTLFHEDGTSRLTDSGVFEKFRLKDVLFWLNATGVYTGKICVKYSSDWLGWENFLRENERAKKSLV
jgi:hypothetical protein